MHLKQVHSWDEKRIIGWMEKIPSGGIDDGSMSVVRSQFPRRFLSTLNFPRVKVPLGASQLVVCRCRWDGEDGKEKWGEGNHKPPSTPQNPIIGDRTRLKAKQQHSRSPEPLPHLSFLLFFIAQSNPHNNSSQNYAKVEAASKWRTDKGEK
jgi:hypothetical protein